MSILQLIPGLSTTGTYTTIVPLMFFVAISMAKEGYEDSRHHRLDKAENTSNAVILDLTDGLSFEKKGEKRNYWCHSTVKKKWHEIQVGVLVHLKRNDLVPADLVLL